MKGAGGREERDLKKKVASHRKRMANGDWEGRGY
jgi:hypothetical protein